MIRHALGQAVTVDYTKRRFPRQLRGPPAALFSSSAGLNTGKHELDLMNELVSQLQVERERLAVTLSCIGDGVIATDTHARITMLNHVAQELTGWTNEEAHGRALLEVFDIVNETTREPAPDPVARALSTGKVTGLANHTALVSKQGRERSIADSCAPIKDAEGKVLGAVLVFRDVTDEKAAADALQLSEERLRSIAESARDAIVCADAYGNIIFWNSGAERDFGRSTAEMLGQPLAAVMPAEFRDAHVEGLRRWRESGADPRSLNRTVELRGVRKDGSEFPLELSLSGWKGGENLYFTGVARDISERKSEQAALESEREHLAVTLASIGDGVISADTGGHILLLNSVAEELTGWSQDEASGRSVSDVYSLISEVTGETVPDPVLRTMTDGHCEEPDDHTVLVARDGRRMSIAHSCSPMRDSQDEILGAVLVFRDITQERRKRSLALALNNIHAAVHSTLDVDSIIERVMLMAGEAVGCEVSALALRQDGGWVVKHASGMPEDVVGMSFSDEEVPHIMLAARSRRAVAIDDAAADERVHPGVMERFGVRSLLTVPLTVKDDVVGMLSFSFHSHAFHFGEDEVDFANSLASTASFALANARLYRSEKMIAETLQESFFKLPGRIEGLEFSHLYRSATASARVGGDFYDIFELGEGRVGVLIGDVSGKGIKAANVTALVKTSVRAYVDLSDSPAEVLRLTNALLTKTTPFSTFATVFFGILDLRSGELEYCNAGHPSPLIRRLDGRVAAMDATSPAVGFFTQFDYADAKAVIGCGDIIVAYTDGVIEARSDGELYGEARLEELMAKGDLDDSHSAVETVFGAVKEFTGDSLADDVAILSLRLLDLCPPHEDTTEGILPTDKVAIEAAEADLTG